MGNMSPFAPASRGRFFVAAILAILTLPICVSAQSDIKLVGQVVDSISGNAIPGASIWIEQLGRNAVSDNRGLFQFGNIPIGEYNLSTSRQGYRTSGLMRITIDAAATRNVVVLMAPEALKVGDQIVTATRSSNFRIESNGNSTIIEFPQGALNSLVELTRQLPELEIVQSNNSEVIRLRGSQSNAVVVMLDGRPQNSSLSSTADISRIPLNSVSRVEIIRGGNYNTGGLAGTINFITEKPIAISNFGMSLEKGSFGLEKYGGGIKSKISKSLDFGLDLATRDSRGDFEFADPRDSIQIRQNNQVNDVSLLSSISIALSRTKVAIKGKWFNRKSGIPGPVFQTTPQAISKINEKEIYSVISSDFSESAGISIVGGLTWRDSKYKSPQTPQSFIPYESEFKEQARDIKVQFQTLGSIGLNLAASARHESLDGRDIIRPSASFGKRSREMNIIGAGAQIKLPSATMLATGGALNLGFRAEGGAGGDFLGPSASLHLNIDLPLSPQFDAAYFKSRRLPDLTDLFWKEDVFASPNPDLKPELSTGFETGISFHTSMKGPLDIRLNRYQTSYDDIIIWRKWGGDKFKPLNLTKAKISGWESALTYRPFAGAFSIYWNGNFMKPHNMESDPLYHGKYLTYRPIEIQNVGVELEIRRFNAELDSRHLGRRYQTEENTKSLPPVNLYDFNIGYTIDLWQVESGLKFSVLNITNEEYEILERQPEKPREYRIQLEIKRGKGL
jgi:vitamin B12 transporter